MKQKNTNLSDFVKEASDSLLLVLSCHTKNCKNYKVYMLNGVVGDFCKYEIIMLTQRYGKSQLHPICEHKYKDYQSKQDYKIDVRDD